VLQRASYLWTAGAIDNAAAAQWGAVVGRGRVVGSRAASGFVSMESTKDEVR